MKYPLLISLMLSTLVLTGCEETMQSLEEAPDRVEIRYVVLDPTLVGRCMIDKSWIKDEKFETAPFIKINKIIENGYDVTVIRSESLYPSGKFVRVMDEGDLTYSDLSAYTERYCPKE